MLSFVIISYTSSTSYTENAQSILHSLVTQTKTFIMDEILRYRIPVSLFFFKVTYRCLVKHYIFGSVLTALWANS